MFQKLVVYFCVLFVKNCDSLDREAAENRDGVWVSPGINTPWFSSLVSCHNAVLEEGLEREYQICGEVGQWTASTRRCSISYRNKSCLSPEERCHLTCFSQRNVKLKSRFLCYWNFLHPACGMVTVVMSHLLPMLICKSSENYSWGGERRGLKARALTQVLLN